MNISDLHVTKHVGNSAEHKLSVYDRQTQVLWKTADDHPGQILSG